jgi:hypothetical protein
MKKLMIIPVLIAFAISVHAQNPVQPDQGTSKKKKTGAFFDVFGAIDFSNINGSQSSNNGTLVGAQFGAGATVLGFSQVMSIRAELAFSMQGTKYSSSSSGGSSSYSSSSSLHLNYINVPIVGRYQTPGGFYGELGIQPGFLVSAKNSYSYNGSSGNTDVKKQYNSFDFGIPIGVGYKFKNNIGVGVRVVPGVSNILSSSSGSSYTSQYTAHNFVTSVRASYAF